MIIDIPPIRYETIEDDEFTHRTVVTQMFLVRIIWTKTQKAIVFRKWTIHFKRHEDD